MEDLRTQARLVPYESTRAGAGAIGTVISRSEVAEAASGGEFPATFLLDLERAEVDGGDVTAHARVAVDWDEQTLEQLLSSTEDQEIALWFDEPELALAFDDVEGHGFRQKAAVLAIAATAAGASAAPSLAAVNAGPGGGSGGGQTSGITAQAGPTVQPMGAERGVQQDAKLGGTPAATTESTTGGVTASTDELAAIAGAGAILISAAGFGLVRKRTRPVQPA